MEEVQRPSDRSNRLPIQLHSDEEASHAVEVAAMEEEAWTWVAGVEVIHSVVSQKIAFPCANCVTRLIISSSSATRGLILHTWGKKNLLMLLTPAVLIPMRSQGQLIR
jgi:hypothetical protein